MTAYVALLRAVNVGGTGKLPMSELKALCEAAGFEKVRTYIASGNVVFDAKGGEADVKAALEARLEAFAGRKVGVLVRTPKEMNAVLAGNPFPEAPPHRVVAIFLDAPPPPDTMQRMTGRTDEEVQLGRREIYVSYQSGIGYSKLRIVSSKDGTARNMNTVARLAEMAAAISD